MLNAKRRERYAERRDAERAAQESRRPDTFTRRRRKLLRDRRWQMRHAGYWSAYKTRWKRVNREKVRGQRERYAARQRGPQPRTVRPLASVSYVPATSTQPAAWVLFDEAAPTSAPLVVLPDPPAVLQWASDHGYDLTLPQN